MALTIHKVKGYADFKKIADELLRTSVLVFAWFAGEEVDGESWCPDCNAAKPIIEEFLSDMNAPSSIHIIYTEIPKENFRSNDCEFKLDKQVKLRKIPTLMSLQGPQRLLESECKNKDLIKFLFDDVFQEGKLLKG